MLCGTNEQQPYVLLTIVLGVIIVFSTILSIACVVTNRTLPQSIRVILLSFSVANLAGTVMLTHDTVTFLCQKHQNTSLTTISVTLSATHLLLLMLSTHINTTKQLGSNQARSYCALIVISWFISIALGTINVIAKPHQKKLIFSVAFFIIVIFAGIRWFPVVRTYKKKEKLRFQYRLQFLQKHPLRPKGTNNKYWKINHVNFILISYLCCSIPWALNEFREGLELTKDLNILDFTILIIYTLNFLMPSGVCIYLKVFRSRGKQLQNDKCNCVEVIESSM